MKRLPLDWKIANVTPIFQERDRKTPDEYQPISLTSLLGKVFGSMIREKKMSNLERHSLIRYSQHGFRDKKSILFDQLTFYNDLFLIYDVAKSLEIVCLDFQKVFENDPPQWNNYVLNGEQIKEGGYKRIIFKVTTSH